MRRLVAALGVASLLSFIPVSAAAAAGETDGLSQAGQRAFSEVAGCVSGSDTLLATIVVDESASLQDTDPQAFRVPAITTAIDALEELQASAGGLRVDVSMSVFARDYDELVSWHELDAQHADRLRGAATDQLPSRDQGDATDYREALQGAQLQLDERAAQIGKTSACKLVLWFTDGALDVDEATSAAATELCQPQGIADSVRADHIVVVALALFTPGAGVTDAQREQLRSVAEGTGAGASCGSVPIATDASGGVYLSAEDPTALRRLFAGAAALIGGDTSGPTVSCPSPECPGGRFQYDVDAGVGGFRLVADVGAGARAPSLVTPSGNRVQLPDSGTKTTDLPEGKLEAFTRDGLTTVTMEATGMPATPSSWTLDLGPAGGAVDVYWSWRAQLALSPIELVAGQDATVEGRLTGPDGTSLDPSLYRELTVGTTVGDRDVRARLSSDGTFTASIPLPRDSTPTSLDVGIEASAVTRGAGIALAPLAYEDRVTVTLPPAFPTVSPGELDLAELEVPGTRSATLDLVGSDLGPTQVCLAGSALEGPEGGAVGATTATGSDCVRLGVGESGQMTVDLTPTLAADGLVSGDLSLELTGAQDSGTIDVAVPARFDMTRAVDDTTRDLLVALLIGLALLLPLLLLLVSEWMLARFGMTPTHQIARIRVLLTAAGPRRVDGTSQLLVSKDVTNLPLSKGARVRRFSVPGTDATLRVTRWWDVLRGARGVVCVPQGRLVASKTAPFSMAGGTRADLGLGKVDTWFVLTDPAAVQSESNVQATLVTVFPTGQETLAERAGDVQRAPWDSIMAVLRGHAESAAPAPSVADNTASVADNTAPGGVSSSDGDPGLPSWLDSPSDTSAPSEPAGQAAMPSWMSDVNNGTPPPSVEQPGRARTSRRNGKAGKARIAPPPAPRQPNDDLPPIDFLK